MMEGGFTLFAIIVIAALVLARVINLDTVITIGIVIAAIVFIRKTIRKGQLISLQEEATARQAHEKSEQERQAHLRAEEERSRQQNLERSKRRTDFDPPDLTHQYPLDKYPQAIKDVESLFEGQHRTFSYSTFDLQGDGLESHVITYNVPVGSMTEQELFILKATMIFQRIGYIYDMYPQVYHEHMLTALKRFRYHCQPLHPVTNPFHISANNRALGMFERFVEQLDYNDVINLQMKYIQDMRPFNPSLYEWASRYFGGNAGWATSR